MPACQRAEIVNFERFFSVLGPFGMLNPPNPGLTTFLFSESPALDFAARAPNLTFSSSFFRFRPSRSGSIESPK